MNRLQHEKSPYLLQHAENPVDWYAWGDEAFDKAKAEDKPIFLSIGYATCHWCHVMAHESFEDDEVAEMLNEHYVSVKVDREERPDIDQLYMTVCQMISGSGGWPLTIFMTPDREPFYATTYVPKEGRFGRPGLKHLLQRISQLWHNDREKVLNTSEEIIGNLRKAEEIGPGQAPDKELLQEATEALKQQYDPEHGGFIQAPKFPSPHNLLFMLRRWKRSGDDELLQMVNHTLTAMRRGGIYDHVGFGFHRYSTDVDWRLPHFEKMLYDQAMLLLAYAEGWQITGNALFQKTAEEIVYYVFDQLADTDGGFYSAEDADTEGEEGKFYVWTLDEIRELLPAADAELVIECYQLEEEGNFEDEATGRQTGANILHLADTPEQLAQERNMTTEQLNDKLDTARQKLLEARKQRERPFKDDKILTDWNGLMIAALARAGYIFNRGEWIEAAEQSVNFILEELVEDGNLLHRYRDGDAAVPALADDYAFFIYGLLEVYQASHKPIYLEQAIKWQQVFEEQCWAEGKGGFYQNSKNSETLPSKSREAYDGAYPSANSMAMNNMLRLARLTGHTDWEQKADELARAFGDMVEQAPTAFTHLLQGIDFALEESAELLLSFPDNPESGNVMIQTVREQYLPQVVLHLKHPANSAKLGQLAEWTRSMDPADDQPTAYLCRNFSCERPVTDADALAELLQQ